MGILVLVDDPSVLELDVEVLIHRVERAADGQVVLELDRNLLPDELLEVGEEQLYNKRASNQPCRLQDLAQKPELLTILASESSPPIHRRGEDAGRQSQAVVDGVGPPPPDGGGEGWEREIEWEGLWFLGDGRREP